MSIAKQLVNECQGHALTALGKGIDDIASEYEDDFQDGSRTYTFVDNSKAYMKEDYIEEVIKL